MNDALKAIDCALCALPEKMNSPEARVMLIAIGLQESRLIHRRQLVGSPPRPTGPATGLWQFERGGGVTGVLSHRSSRDYAHALCRIRDVDATPGEVWAALQHDDVLAAGFARLLLWTDPYRLPALGDDQAAWDLYIRTWRPGKPHRQTWDALYKQAVELGANGARDSE